MTDVNLSHAKSDLKIGVIVAARMGSTRLPGKALLPLRGVPMLGFLLQRIKPSVLSSQIVLATTTLHEDDVLEDVAQSEKISVFRGSNEDVVSRYVAAAEYFGFDYVVRVTGDCPFVDAKSLDYAIKYALEHRPFDLATTKGLFPVGIDYEIYPASLMKQIDDAGELDINEREHLTLRFYNRSSEYSIVKIRPPMEWNCDVVLTVDTKSDFDLAQKIGDALPNTLANVPTILDLFFKKKAIVRSDFSKPLKDVALENTEWQKNDKENKQRQDAFLRSLQGTTKRTRCLLCDTPLPVASFLHRQTRYLLCEECGHIQSEQVVSSSSKVNFSTTYPLLDKDAWQSRCQRIYQPKLEWILRQLRQERLLQGDPVDASWFEIGVGAGYFLGALHEAGIAAYGGIEANPELAKRVQEKFGQEKVICGQDIASAIQNSTAQIYTAFFVLEHLEEQKILIDALKAKPEGTVFVFSVPTFGLTPVLDAIFTENAAKCLDGAVHRQLFTEKSIDYLLHSMGYRPVAQWLFGQDAIALTHTLLSQAQRIFNDSLYLQFKSKSECLLNDMQKVIDKHFLCDARHILAIRDKNF